MSSPAALTGSALDVYRRGTRSLDVSLHPAQREVYESRARFVAAIAGSQSGKTVIGPPWLHAEMREQGAGDYGVISPTYKLMERKVVPVLTLYFCTMLGAFTYLPRGSRYIITPRGEAILFGEPQRVPTQIFLSHAQNAESLESATLKALWLDECGQKQFRLESWEASQRRLSLFRARALLTTTPYNLGWLKQRVADRARAGDPDYDLVNFPSTANPFFDPAEDARLRRDLPPWKYEMFHQGRFTRPAGLIYDSFNPAPFPEGHVAGRFPVPRNWPRHVGLDFGGVNTAAVFFAEQPKTGKLYLYREYLEGGRTAAAHAQAIREGEPAFASVTGGSASEGQWRHEFRAAGLQVRRPPIRDVEVGIDRVYGAHARNEIVAFADCTRYLEQKQIYARELDDVGEPTERIEDKETFHLLDAERYAIAHLRSPKRGSVEPRRARSYSF